ncbi:SymE family type I addiction module toxin [Cupriavidus sp. IK-TO18]|uniref:Type I toxin-antitoxin system SymE family toxin n=1 Tax=Cupriavidus oxalaticus TaxID=96344 RepID=A0A4P7LIA3_9BURK|nr:SymE family type I addiction module toxin [Cupriavidus oxalaticus]MBF6991116.1 type I addiction module toxin, SymE family [Cupriavidus sp. IK-TO18]QBY54309.1 type I toxin-antitoxin system SymE family toxin [Cupriavidus oxalaticus]
MKIKSTGTHVRTIKISRTQFPAVPSNSNNFTGLRTIPWIRLRGLWLERAGFSVGQSLKVRVQHKRIVIWVE